MPMDAGVSSALDDPGLSDAQTHYRYEYSIVACARWEERDIAEWISYHQSLGFDHIYIYSNDDDPTEFFRALAPFVLTDKPFVTFKHFPKRNPTQPQQHEIYLHFLRHHKHETQWFSLLDIDEFFVFKNSSTVKEFMAPYKNDYDAIYFNWLIYGHAYKKFRDGDSVLLSHVRRARNIDIHTKWISRSAKIDAEKANVGYVKKHYRGFWHFWNDYEMEGLRITNVLRDDIDSYTQNFPEWALSYVRRPAVGAQMIATAYVAHFQFKSAEDLKRRVLRGGSHTVAHWKRVVEEGRDQKMLAPPNEVWDPYLANYWLKRFPGAFDWSTETVISTDGLTNVALRKPSRQSSIAEQPDDASGCIAPDAVQGHANNGLRTGGFGFATLHEDRPWWMVDLLGTFSIAEIHIYNCQKTSEIAATQHLAIEISDDQTTWLDVVRIRQDAPFGGIGSMPLRVVLPTPLAAQYLRISACEPCILQFDEIEVYATPFQS
ncbi:MAG TPA: glycosyltransferase family 2 protein [Stellaceae bacterium]|jgi:hypothetical protein|nr:glycosyltransferase family 2 protein [Stellaceae bacterium]